MGKIEIKAPAKAGPYSVVSEPMNKAKPFAKVRMLVSPVINRGHIKSFHAAFTPKITIVIKVDFT